VLRAFTPFIPCIAREHTHGRTNLCGTYLIERNSILREPTTPFGIALHALPQASSESRVPSLAFCRTLLDGGKARGVQSLAEARAATRALTDAAVTRYLKEQISMRVIGCGWSQFDTPWSSNVDPRIGTHAHLLEVLGNILVYEAAQRSANRLPTVAAPPTLRASTLKVLGTPTCDIEEIEKECEISVERLEEAALEEQARRAAAGITDDVQDIMPFAAPPLTSEALLNKRLEILWGTYVLPDGTRTKIWCPCTVMRVADGSNDKGTHGKTESSRARKLLPAGAVLVRWDPDHDRGEDEATVMWLVLSPEKWTTRWEGHLAWRWHPDELAQKKRWLGEVDIHPMPYVELH